MGMKSRPGKLWEGNEKEQGFVGGKGQQNGEGGFHCWAPEQEVGKGGKIWKLEVPISFGIIRHESTRRSQQGRT